MILRDLFETWKAVDEIGKMKLPDSFIQSLPPMITWREWRLFRRSRKWWGVAPEEEAANALRLVKEGRITWETYARGVMRVSESALSWPVFAWWKLVEWLGNKLRRG